ncbi:RING finger protein 32-like isoform X2 [Liolophura sinensis]
MPHSSSTLMAAAFQDHLIRSMALTDMLGPRKVLPGKATQKLMKKEIRPLVDTGRVARNPVKPKAKEEKEYVLDTTPAPLTLAQKLGLVEAPPQLMSEGQWQAAKAKSNRREDSDLPCVICKEDFGLQQQVLLSCTHVFHRACLEAFERFTGKKTCPMCRKQQYQTRVIHEGAKKHRVKCVTKIQAMWRGYVVRCWYRKLRESHPPNDPKLRKKFYEDKLESITDRMVRSCDFNINRFLSEIDQSLEASREVFRNFDTMFHRYTEEDWEKIQLKAVDRGETECPICLTSLWQQEVVEPVQKKPLPEKSISPQKSDRTSPKRPTGNRFSQHRERAQNMTNCIDSSTECVGDEAPKCSPVTDTPRSLARQVVLLSCSHVFHLTCLETFEELAVLEKKNVCPVCRTNYQKRTI